MAYNEKTDWKLTDTVMPADMNRIEQGIADAAEKAELKAVQKFQLAGGTATAIVLSDVLFEDGFSKTFVVKDNNNQTPTTINGKPLYKPGTAVTPRLIAGKAVTIWYDSSDECFYVADYIGDALIPGTQGGIGDIIPTNADLLGGKSKEYFEALVDAVSQRVTENLTSISIVNNQITTINDNLANKLSKRYGKINDTQINKPWLVLESKWADVPTGVSMGVVQCGTEYGAFIYKLNAANGSAIISSYAAIYYMRLSAGALSYYTINTTLGT